METGYRVPDLVFKILNKFHYPISRIVCFTTGKAKVRRIEFKEVEKLMDINDFFLFQYQEFRYIDSEFFETVEAKISKEMEEANIIIDVTPLSKLFSFKLLELANKYQIACIYLGMDKLGDDKLYWMSNMKIEGEIVTFS